jgi:hypothetical protein
VGLVEQPPPPDIDHNNSGAVVQNKCGGSLKEVLGGGAYSGVGCAQASDLQKGGPQFAQCGLPFVALLDSDR